MEKRTKIVIGIIVIAIIVVLIYTNLLLAVLALIFGFMWPDSYKVDLVEINSNLTDVENRSLTYLSEEEFRESPELRELFHNITPAGEEEFNGRDIIFTGNHISVRPEKAREIRNGYGKETFYWKGGYFGILIEQP